MRDRWWRLPRPASVRLRPMDLVLEVDPPPSVHAHREGGPNEGGPAGDAVSIEQPPLAPGLRLLSGVGVERETGFEPATFSLGS